MGWYRSSRRQEHKYRTPRAFSIRGEWRYSRNRSDERAKAIKRGVRSVVGINQWLGNVWLAIRKLLGYEPFKPARIEPDRYIVEAVDEEETRWYSSI